MKKDFYHYYEIIEALRGHYQEAQKLINRMKQDIVVDSKEPYDLKMFLRLRCTEVVDGEQLLKKPTIELRITRNFRNNIGSFARHCLNSSELFNGNKFVRYFYDNVDYVMEEKDGKYSFDYSVKQYPWIYKPNASIPNAVYDDFNELYGKLKELPLFNLPQESIDINPYQSLWLEGTGLTFVNDHLDDTSLFIDYEAEDDKIHVETQRKVDTFKIEKLMETKIPRIFLPKELLELLDQSNVEEKYVSFNDPYIIKKPTVFDMKEKTNDLLVLTKVKK